MGECERYGENQITDNPTVGLLSQSMNENRTISRHLTAKRDSWAFE